MTPEQAKMLAQPIVDIYAQLTDELMTSIAAQLGKNNSLTDTAEWQLKKLAQLGELNDRNLRTIARRTSGCPELYYQAVVDAASQALSETDSLFSAAAAAEELQIPTEYPASISMMNRLKIYQDQARDLLNLTNTTMAYKARDAYTGIVNRVAALANDEEYRKILGKNAASVVTGIQSRQAALRQCLNEFAEKGMPGFVDRAGREWAPESYINMNLRTTVSNVANEAQFARMDDYGNDLIEVSSHIGARPKCAPYQGRLYSRSGRSGFTEDLHGNKIAFAPWGSTSYGDPGGLLGVRCGHNVYPFIPGYDVQRYFPYNEKENELAYKQSQKQRYLERKERESKRECAMLEAAGDQEGFEKAAVKLKQRQAALKQFAEETGRTLKPDRVQVHGFGRSQAAKATQANDHAIKIKNENFQYTQYLHDLEAKKVPLKEKQQKIYFAISERGSSVILRKKEVALEDLAALTAFSGDEFAIFTKGYRRMVVHGTPTGCNIYGKDADLLLNEQWEWTGHSHPTTGKRVLPSNDDIKTLSRFTWQKKSSIINLDNITSEFTADYQDFLNQLLGVR